MAIKMYVNNVDISTYQAIFVGITPANRTVTNATEMIDGLTTPIMCNPNFGIREYTLRISIHGRNRKEIWDNVGSILEVFSKIVDVRLEGFSDNKGEKDKFFKFTLTRVDQTEYGALQAGWHVLELTCAGYEYGNKKSIGIAAHDLVFKEIDSSGKATAVCEVAAEQVEGQAPVFVDVGIKQCSEDRIPDNEGFYSGIVGEKYPLYADIKLYGLCKSRMGKELGNVEIYLRPDDHFYPGGGATAIFLDGQNGMLTVLETNGMYPTNISHDIPAPLKIGFPEQKIRVEVTAYEMQHYKHEYDIQFIYTPIFL